MSPILYAQDLRVETGKFVGAGIDTFIVASFPIKFAWYKGDGAINGVMKFAVQGDDTCSIMDVQADITDGRSLKRISGDKLFIGDSSLVNAVGVEYNYMFIGGDAAEVGRYVGNTIDDRTIPLDVSWKPGLVLIKSDNTRAPAYRPYHVSGDSTLSTRLTWNVDAIQQINYGNIQIGSHDWVNGSNTMAYYLAIKEDSNYLLAGYYFGDGSDNRDIPLPGATFISEFAITKRNVNNVDAIWKTQEMQTNHGDRSHSVYASTYAVNWIQDISQAGIIEIGSQWRVNGDGIRHDYFMLRNYVEPPEEPDERDGFPSDLGWPGWFSD